MIFDVDIYSSVALLIEYKSKFYSGLYIYLWGARGEIVIVVGNEHGDTSSNPGREW